MAGKAFGFKIAILFIKGDLGEQHSTWGLPSTASDEHPCAKCKSDSSNFFNLSGLNALGGLPFERKTHAEYEAACRLCEIRVPLRVDDRPTLMRIRAALSYDTRTYGSLGRALDVPLPDLHLRKGDRLEPTVELGHTAAIDNDNICPIELVFWRRSQETSVRHRNPVFIEELGLTPSLSLASDWLHCLSQGTFKTVLITFCKVIYDNNCFNLPGGSVSATMEGTTSRLRYLLFSWYRSELRNGRQHTQVQNLTTSMLQNDLGLHASETNGFAFFCLHLTHTLGDALPSRREWERCLAAGCELMKLIHANRYRLEGQAAQEYCDATKVFVRCCQNLGVEAKPKHHDMIHLAADAHIFGSPALSATWHDEGVNRFLKAIGSNAHRACWARRVLSDFYMTHGLGSRCKRRRRALV